MMLKPASLIVATALVAAPAFAQNAATVNGKPIPAARVDQIVKAEVAQGRAADTPEVREQVKKGLIGREVMAQEADKQGYNNKADVKAAVEDARQQILISALVQDYLKKHPVSDADIKAEYDKVKAQLGDKEYHARHILVPTEDEAKQIIAKIKGGAKFEDLAKQYGTDGTRDKGGDLDWASPANYDADFSKGMVALQKGQVTETPVKSKHGYHVIKLEDVRASTLPPLEQVKQQVAQQVQQRRLTEYRDALIKKAKIQ
jgi:peptidyl-prolyl cis-trans isomerase C